MKVPKGYKRLANGKLAKTTTKKKATKRKGAKKKSHHKKGKGVGSVLMAGAKLLGPAILSSLVADEVTKRMKRGNGLKLLGMK